MIYSGDPNKVHIYVYLFKKVTLCNAMQPAN